MEILSKADVTFTSTYRELLYGVSDLIFEVNVHDSFTFTTYHGMGYGPFGTSNRLIDVGASFSLEVEDT